LRHLKGQGENMAAARTGAAWQRMAPTLISFVLIVLAAACLYWARPVLIPTAMAVLLTFLLSPPVTWLQRRRVPRPLAIGTVVLVAGLLVAGVGWLFASQVLNLADKLPTYQDNVTRRIEELRGDSQDSLLAKVQDFVKEVRAAATQPTTPAAVPPADEPQEVKVVSDGLSAGLFLAVFGPIFGPLASAGLVIVLVIFFLISR
jgi:predicted PurR-regulated permease PerM